MRLPASLHSPEWRSKRHGRLDYHMLVLSPAEGRTYPYDGTIVSKFIGGSAYAMARDIGGGFVNVTERTFKAMTPADLNQLVFEIDRFLRELRGSRSATEEIDVVKTRNRKIQRLNTAVMISRTYRQKTRMVT